MKAVICLEKWREARAIEESGRLVEDPGLKDSIFDITPAVSAGGFPEGTNPKFFMDNDTFTKIRGLLGTHVLEIRLRNVSQ